MEPMTRVELVNLFLTKEALYQLSYMGVSKQLKYLRIRELLHGAGDEIRTRDIQLGRLKLYQLSYSRINHLYSQQTKIDYVVTIHSKLRSPTQYFWWWGEDLNLRRLSRQIYSLIPLTTREPHQSISISGADTPNRTEDILITSEMLYQLSYIGSS
jgi:hypothetical protein